MKLHKGETMVTPARRLPVPDWVGKSDEAQDTSGHDSEQIGTAMRDKHDIHAEENLCRCAACIEAEVNRAWVDGLSMDDLILVHLLLQGTP